MLWAGVQFFTFEVSRIIFWSDDNEVEKKTLGFTQQFWHIDHK